MSDPTSEFISEFTRLAEMIDPKLAVAQPESAYTVAVDFTEDECELIIMALEALAEATDLQSVTE